MTEKKKRKIPLMEFSRDGVDTLSEVSAFLGGIFFTALLMLVQQRNAFADTVLEISLQQHFILITKLHLIVIPLSVSIILFIFSSLFFGIACSRPEQSEFDRLADKALGPFLLAVLSMLISLVVVLFIVEMVAGVIGITLSIGTLLWWIRTIRKE